MSSSNSDTPTFNRPVPSDSCSTLIINTTLATPKAEIIETLNKGDTLRISIASDQGPIQAITLDGQVAGTILSREQVKLLSCIVGGTTYEAEVLSRNDGECNVQIRPI